MADDDVLGTRRDERDTLVGFLDWYRAVIERKVEGLSGDDASRVVTPSGLSPLGIVQHLAYVERSWFRKRLTGERVETLHQGDDNAVQFELDPGTSVDSVLAFYRDECERSRAIVADAALDDVSVDEHPVYGQVTLRWILVHMIEETARHAGHLDLMREQIDGRTGD
jgi:uncharacterized damage-inducible protein DinB